MPDRLQSSASCRPSFLNSLRNRLYYLVKPAIPKRLRIRIRSWFATRKRNSVAHIWPIAPDSGHAPEGWHGWPDGRKFALVLTHDVEGQDGVDNCEKLLELEKECGFRSSFNFVPEGDYQTPPELRQRLRLEGFEVGIHDLRHDGLLYHSRKQFAINAGKINQYLEQWGAVGFRSGFMLNRLDWLHVIDIKYDASTFDTDPFEPQPEGRGTIFPFWVPAEANRIDGERHRKGYVELPYTLPQDSTLFLLLGDKTPEVWLRKLDWIAEHGGMALVNIHPDYIDFSGNGTALERYPAAFIREFLGYVSKKYAGLYWNPVAKELAEWFAASQQQASSEPAERPVAHANLKGKRAAVLLYSYYPADPRPRRAAEALIGAGMEVDLFCLREKESEPLHETIDGVNVFRMPMPRVRGNAASYMWRYARFILSSFWFLLKRGWSGKYDLVHVHNMPDVLVFAALVPKMRGARVILDLHDPMPELMTSIYGLNPGHLLVRTLRVFERWSIRFANLALTPNVTFKNLFVSRSCRPEKMQIVMNSPNQKTFDPDLYSAESAPVGADAEFRIMHHGEIVKRHGIDLLVEAVAKVRPQIPGVRLDIYGSRTPFIETVLELAKTLGIEEVVHYHGPKTQKEIAAAIRNCHLGVVPNRRLPFTEINFPTRIFEFLSMHRPVIAPSTQGIRDYFEPGQLLTFEPGNVEDLAARMLWAYNHPNEVATVVERGVEVYRGHLWEGEKSRFLENVSGLFR